MNDQTCQGPRIKLAAYKADIQHFTDHYDFNTVFHPINDEINTFENAKKCTTLLLMQDVICNVTSDSSK